MADNDNPTPAQQKKEKKLFALAFLYADVGERVLEQLRKDNSCGRVFSAEVVEKIRQQVVTPVMEAFLEKACPTVKGNPEMARWVCSQYLTHRHNGKPIKAEDLYKIGKNIAFFNGLRTSPYFREPKKQLLQYDTYAAFEQMLEPYRQAKAQKEAEAKDRHMDPQERVRILAETTILYDGPEGKVVIPHTPAASQYWGDNTKWCIAGREGADRMFPAYNAQSPVIMLLPKGQPDNKIALVDHVLYDSADKTIDSLPSTHDDLMQRCLEGLSEGVRNGITPLLRTGFVFPVDHTIGQPVDSPLLKAIREDLRNPQCRNKDVTPELWRNRDFALAAMKLSGYLHCVDESLRGDREIALAAIQQRADAFNYVGRGLMGDREFLLDAIRVNDEVHIPRYLQQDSDFITRLLETVGSFPFKIRHWDVKVWQPDDAALVGYQIKALERMAKKGDTEKFTQYARHFKCTWGDPDTLFAADPAATLEKIRTEVAVRYPAASRRVALPAARMAV